MRVYSFYYGPLNKVFCGGFRVSGFVCIEEIKTGVLQGCVYGVVRKVCVV